ncbi:MAG: alpha/beta hydrolase, partial [Actinomycetota bacterium]|nr:alpha/beta hydrolase [Actinomycetota bacterium]
NPFPAGLDDVAAVYEWLIGPGGVAPSNIVLAGDSAGGGLCAALLLRLRDAGRPLPAGAFVISPHLSFSEYGETLTSRQGVDPYFPGSTDVLDQMQQMQQLYLPDGHVNDPHVSPNSGDLSGLPPVLIHVGDCEVLLSHSTTFADKAAAAGVDVEVVVWPEAFHVFHFYVGMIPEADEALAAAGSWIADNVRSPVA